MAQKMSRNSLSTNKRQVLARKKRSRRSCRVNMCPAREEKNEKGKAPGSGEPHHRRDMCKLSTLIYTPSVPEYESDLDKMRSISSPSDSFSNRFFYWFSRTDTFRPEPVFFKLRGLYSISAQNGYGKSSC